MNKSTQQQNSPNGDATVVLYFLLGRLSSAGRGGRAAGFRYGIAKMIVSISNLKFFEFAVGSLKMNEISKIAVKSTYFKYCAPTIRGF